MWKPTCRSNTDKWERCRGAWAWCLVRCHVAVVEVPAHMDLQDALSGLILRRSWSGKLFPDKAAGGAAARAQVADDQVGSCHAGIQKDAASFGSLNRYQLHIASGAIMTRTFGSHLRNGNESARSLQHGVSSTGLSWRCLLSLNPCKNQGHRTLSCVADEDNFLGCG